MAKLLYEESQVSMYKGKLNMIPTLSVCFKGTRASKMPYDETSAEYGRFENVLKSEIIRLIRMGVSEFYTSGQPGIDMLAALLVLNIKDELGTTARLNLALPYKNMYTGFSQVEKNNFRWILKNADTVRYPSEKYAPGCYRETYRYMVERSDYLVAVTQAAEHDNGVNMIISMAKKKGLEIILIDPLKFMITREQGKQSLFNW